MSSRKAFTAAALAAPLLLTGYKKYYAKKSNEVAPEEKRADGRVVLPTNVKPKTYTVTLAPDFETFDVMGHVDIDLDIIRRTKSVVLNSKGLEFGKVTVSFGTKTMTATQITINEEEETASLDFDGVIPVGSARVAIDFMGVMAEKLHGFYRSAYTKDGQKKFMGTTQFEATHAREAFPCWDEPEIKAVFEIILTVPKDLIALSNMPIVSTVAQGAVKVVTYEPTPIVSTYLLAWVIGEFEYIEATTKDNIKCRVYTQAGKTDQGKFALSVCTRVLEFFTEYFDIAYPLPKMDMVAIPDFAAGAMENWGLVTYRETALLYDEKASSAAAKERVAYVVAHELAHQWFGNLVSPGWWSYLWLNEGFATWAGNLATNQLFPEWEVWTKFVSDYTARALTADALASSHPIEVRVDNAGMISEIFDAISYLKGSSVIRMLANYLGGDTFRNGLRTYLKDKQFSCATTEDLWAHCSKASGKDVATLMDKWVKETGYPFLTVQQGQQQAGGKLSLDITQQKFLATGVSTDGSGPVWHCHVTVITGVGSKTATTAFDLSTRSGSFAINLPEGTEAKDEWWVKVNLGTSNFYRVNYSDDLLQRLETALPALQNPVDRMSVQNDMFALAQAGACSTASFLRIAKGYRDETDYSIWGDLTSSLSALRNLYDQENLPQCQDLRKFVRWLYGPVVAKVGWEPKDGDSHSTTLLRSLVIGAAGKAGCPAVIAEAQKRFKAHVDGSAQIPMDMRSCVCSLAVANGGETEYNQLLELYTKADMQEDKVGYLRCLGSPSDPALLLKTLEFGLSDSVRSQDSIYCVASVAANARGRPVAWQWIQTNWDTIMTTFGGGQFMIANIVQYVCAGFASTPRHSEIKAFFDGREVPGAAMAIKQATEKVGMSAAWLTRDQAGSAAFLAGAL